VITACDSGLNTTIGELRLKVSELLQTCAKKKDDGFSQTYILNRPGTKKPLTWTSGIQGDGAVNTAKIQLNFKAFTYFPPNQATPLMMVSKLMAQALDPTSRLLQASNVLGPTFREIRGAWDELTIYLSSVYDEFHAERMFLTKYVLPALAKQCSSLRIKLKWYDSSSAEAPGCKDNVVKRVSTLQNCVMRSQAGETPTEYILVALVGLRRGRMLDARDVRRLRDAKYTHEGGLLDWVEKAHATKEGLSVQELEIRMATTTNAREPSGAASTSDLLVASQNPCAVLCLRDAGFLESTQFKSVVPSDVRRLYQETDATKKEAAAEFRKFLRRAMNDKVLEFKPKFDYFSYPWEEGVNTNERKAAESVHLAGLAEFGCGVYERLWLNIRQRFPSSRGKASGNFYVIELQRQRQLILGLVQQMVLVRSGTQLKSIQKLKSCAYFFEESQSDVTFFLGGHGSGRSSIVAQLLWDLEVSQDSEMVQDRSKLESSEGLSKLKSTVVGLKALVGIGRKGNGAGPVLRRTESDFEAKTDYMNIAEEEGNEQQRGKSSHGKTNQDFFYGVDGPRQAEVEEQEVLFEKRLEASQERMTSMGMDTREIKIRMKKPMLVYFLKQPSHNTRDVMSFLCSSLLEEQDALPASWKRLQQIVHVTCLGNTDSAPDPLSVNFSNCARPVLFVLDGLDKEERDEVRRIVVQFPGRCRAIMTAHETARPALLAKARETSRHVPPQVVMACPLNNIERHEILMELLKRTGAKRLPTNLNCVTNHAHSAAPLYLKCLAACVKAHIGLQIRPPPMSSYFPHLVHLLSHNFLAVLDEHFGQLTIQVSVLTVTHTFF